VQKNDRRLICGTRLGVSDVQKAGIDLLERGEWTGRRIRGNLQGNRTGSSNWS
jgi:hypothetical protein